MYCLSLDTTIKTSCALPAVPAPTAGVREVVCGACLAVLCRPPPPTGRGGLWLCPRLTMAHHRDMGVPARDRAKAKAMTRAIARRHTTGIIGLLELNGFFACTAGTPYCIGAAHIACPRSKPVLDVRVQPYATWQHGHHGIVCIEASATICAHALPLMIISTSF